MSRRVYGDSRYWYVLAEANGFGTADEALPGGVLLRVPELGVTRNSADTFKPYNPMEAMGSASPALPYIAPSQNNCGAVGAILMVVVAVVASVVTFGAALAALPAAVGPMAGAIIAGAAAGAAGAAASGVVGSLTGAGSFSWRAVASGAISGALTGGITQGIGHGQSIGEAMKAGNYGRAAAMAVANPLASYAGNKLAGVEGTSFSWRSIAASAVGSTVSAGIGNKLGLNPSKPFEGSGSFVADFANGLIGGVVTAHARKALGVGSVNEGQIALESLASAAGGAIGNRIEGARVDRATERLNRQLGEINARTSEKFERTLTERIEATMRAREDARLAASANEIKAKIDARLAERGASASALAPPAADTATANARGTIRRASNAFRGAMWDGPISISPVEHVSGTALVEEIFENPKWAREAGYVNTFDDFKFYQQLRAERREWIADATAREAVWLSGHAADRERQMRAEIREVTNQMEASIAPALIPGLLGRLAGNQFPSLKDGKGFDFTTVFLNSENVITTVGSGGFGTGGSAEKVFIGSGRDKVTYNPVGHGLAWTGQTELLAVGYNFAEGESPVETSLGGSYKFAAGFGLDVAFEFTPSKIQLTIDGVTGLGTFASFGGVSYLPESPSPFLNTQGR